MSDSFRLEKIPYRRFRDFIAPGADRFAILLALLEELRLAPSVVTLAGNRHILISSETEGHPEERGPAGKGRAADIILAAHYDRAAGSPGANDNGAAVFMLIETALKMREDKTNPWRIIFTDKEELGPGEGIRDQGSYTLAKHLKEKGFNKSRVFIFDACGAGDTLIISTMTDRLLKNDRRPGTARTRYLAAQLRGQALKTARDILLERVLLLPTPFSDDAGFLRAGIPAQTITVLPAEEAVPFISFLRNKPDFADALISREVQELHGRNFIPATWRSLNGPGDNQSRLTPRHFEQVVRFARALCRD
ncbi:MAG: Zn-dependent exopeptidase M28 [Treponema sp.]|jgi:hypothetical protein|nr:Zn-dependent exopeptidase M28 [Treponema sp.]